MMPEIIAMYLPQFHRTTDNDTWWGEGFTDWVSTRHAKPLFDGHYQPHVPKDEYYYDMSDKETICWQADLMKKYGIDGICMYHYWFENGRRALEKPEQNLLEWKDIEMPFCLCWANESWVRSWSNAKNSNPWVVSSENEKQVGDGILLRQEYGKRDEWEEHFEYLLPYFQDDRYIKLDGKPVFLFYKANEIDCLKEMTDCWRQLAKKNGLSGIYLIGNLTEGLEPGTLDACIFVEPRHSIGKVMQGMYHDGITRLSFTDVWQSILAETGSRINTFFGGFVGYDDSPRRGINGKIIENATPELFGGFLAELIAKNAANGNELTFINAWNEWGEGMHLEPDEKNGYRYLEKIKEAKENYKELIPYYTGIKRRPEEDKNEKHELYLNDMDAWMCNRENGLLIGKWLINKGYHNIAVYGCGIMGRHLISEIQDNGRINIKYIVERRKEAGINSYPVLYPWEDLPKVDILIISSYYFFEDIIKDLPREMNVISLREIILRLNSKLE